MLGLRSDPSRLLARWACRRSRRHSGDGSSTEEEGVPMWPMRGDLLRPDMRRLRGPRQAKGPRGAACRGAGGSERKHHPSIGTVRGLSGRLRWWGLMITEGHVEEQKLMAAFAKAMDRLQKTEGGKIIRGMVVISRPWIYWSVTHGGREHHRYHRRRAGRPGRAGRSPEVSPIPRMVSAVWPSSTLGPDRRVSFSIFSRSAIPRLARILRPAPSASAE